MPTILITFAICIPIYYCVCYCLAKILAYCCEKAGVKSFQKATFPAEAQNNPELIEMDTIKQDDPGQENEIIVHPATPAVM